MQLPAVKQFVWCNSKMTISRGQCRAARALLEWSQTYLADAAGLGRSTIADFERGSRNPSPESMAAIRDALEAGGIEFIPENGGGLGLRLRNRASS